MKVGYVNTSSYRGETPISIYIDIDLAESIKIGLIEKAKILLDNGDIEEARDTLYSASNLIGAIEDAKKILAEEEEEDGEARAD